ncbi:MAG TPA: hypothetical protein GX695_05530 [Acholeplasmataceae bacterium]|nr:hypothetical protein [Acholeplasmataceae bacterium]
MFLASQLLQWGIITGLIVFFILVTILNQKTKAPEGVDIPDECMGCSSSTCIIKTTDIEKIKSEIKEIIEESIEVCEIEQIYNEGNNNEKK